MNKLYIIHDIRNCFGVSQFSVEESVDWGIELRHVRKAIQMCVKEARHCYAHFDHEDGTHDVVWYDGENLLWTHWSGVNSKDGEMAIDRKDFMKMARDWFKED